MIVQQDASIADLLALAAARCVVAEFERRVGCSGFSEQVRARMRRLPFDGVVAAYDVVDQAEIILPIRVFREELCK